MSKNYSLASALALALSTSFGCDSANEIHVEPGSSARALTLHAYQLPDSADGSGGITRITVGRCGATSTGPAVWNIERRPGVRWFGPRETTRFRYGLAPSARWTITHPSEPLDSGCFYAVADGGAIFGLTFFRVRSDGTIETVPNPYTAPSKGTAP